MKKVAFLLIAFSAVLAACDKQAANRPYAVDEQLERNVEQTCRLWDTTDSGRSNRATSC